MRLYTTYAIKANNIITFIGPDLFDWHVIYFEMTMNNVGKINLIDRPRTFNFHLKKDETEYTYFVEQTGLCQ